ncbi:MAG TPA: YihY/virulence factor BrkB family protein [Bryobacteraceae bacterium]|nr:YihY/virulence factor BrkB family protein [Bryobacteraceae bacterium]
MATLFSPAPPSRWSRAVDAWRPTLRYCMQTEVHVYALAVAASLLLSFYPFLNVMLSFCRDVLRWPAAVDTIYLAMNDYLPGDLGAFLKRNLPLRGTFQPVAMLLLLVSANGIFEPLEVALNRAWGVTTNRSYLRNQLVSLGMIFLCGGLALLSLMLTGMNVPWVRDLSATHGQLELWIKLLIFKAAAIPISIVILFLIYWILPNRRIPAGRVAPVAILAGLVLEGMKYVFLLIWPLLHLKLEREYGVFRNSVTILLWGFASAMIVLAAAQWAAHLESQNERRFEKGLEEAGPR